MKEDNRSLFTGQVVSYNGTFGFIKTDTDNLFFHRKGLKENKYPCKYDTVTFRIRPSRKQKGKNEAYDIILKSYGNFRETYNHSVRLGNPNVHIGIIKWFDNEKGFGIIISLNDEEFFWRESSFMSDLVYTGDSVIFISGISNGKKIAKKCRFPRCLEDWAYISTIKDTDADFIINTYCKINPDVYGGMGHKDIKYNIKTSASTKILQQQNFHLFEDSSILSDLILYHASHSSWMHFSITSFRQLYSDYDFKKLCADVYRIIQNYTADWGVKYLFDFVFVEQLIDYSSLAGEEKKKLINTQINNRLIFKNERTSFNRLHPTIGSNKFKIIKEISFAIQSDKEMLLYLFDQILPLLDAETLILLFFDKDTDTYFDKAKISNDVVSRYLLSLGLRKEFSKWKADVPFYGIDLTRNYFNNSYIDNNVFSGHLFRNSSKFDVLKLILLCDLVENDVKVGFLSIIVENSSSASINLILNDDDVNQYILPKIGESKKVLDKIFYSKNDHFIQKLKDNSDSYSKENYINLLKSGLLPLPDYETVFNLTRGLEITYLVDAFHLLLRRNRDNYWEFFERIYSLLSLEERMYLWLADLNNIYNYPELIQTSYLLSTEKRKLLNKKIKEHAKSERFSEFLDQIPNAEIEIKDGSIITYKCKWRNLYYKDGEIIVFLNKSEALPTVKWFPAREEWNWLTNEYFKRKRINDILVVTNNRIVVDIKGLDEIEERIIIADIQKRGSTNHKLNISNEQLVRIIHNVAARNKCIDFLSRQDSQFDAIDIQELVPTQYGEFSRDISFMFIVPNGSYAYIIWESVEFEKSKATYIFRCNVDSAILHADNIKKYIEANIRVRSNLSSNSNFEEVRTELKFFAKINHDSQKYEIWEARIKEVLPFMK